MQQPLVLGPHRSVDVASRPTDVIANLADYGSLTLLFSQTVSGLQVKMPDGQYKDIKPLKGSIVVNVADTLSFMTKGGSRVSSVALSMLTVPGYLKSTIHRVTRPPPDQDHIHRVGVIYGCRPNDDCPVVVAPSPLLKRLGMVTDEDLNVDPSQVATAAEYVASRVKAVHGSSTYGTAPGTKFKHKNLEVLENYADVQGDWLASI
jgi:isopenicillin N synthase-like dioxygenase